MSLPLQVIQAALSKSSQFIGKRAELNLPASESSFPFRKKQREAVELALSNVPVVTIAGTPAAGKTQIALAALSTAIEHQRSTLIVAPFSSTFRRYEQLALPPLQIDGNQDYRQSVKEWIVKQVSNPKLDFLPPHWLVDSLFEELQTKRGRQFWINLLREEDYSQLTDKLAQMVEEILPTVHPKRQQLLVNRLKQSENLLEHRERLFQDYTTLSDNALESIVDAAISNIKAPILCCGDYLDMLDGRAFDLVIVEDSHQLSLSVLQKISSHATKIVFLGELVEENNTFRELFQNLLAAYRIELTENHRLHPDLAPKIFPAIYPSLSNRYTPAKQEYIPLPQGSHRLTWYDVKTVEQTHQTLKECLNNSSDKQSQVLVFSCEQRVNLQKIFPNLIVRSIEDWPGQQCEAIWIVIEKSDNTQLNLTNLRLALTRASEKIRVISDWEYYKSLFILLSSDFHFVRDIAIKED